LKPPKYKTDAAFLPQLRYEFFIAIQSFSDIMVIGSQKGTTENEYNGLFASDP
jgi:hypothetical protein